MRTRTFNLADENDRRELDARATRGEFLRSGESMRCPLSMADAQTIAANYRAGARHDSKPRITDGGGNAAFSRPGFRIAHRMRPRLM
jgi:hypothetical protein